ncbi:MAG: ATP-binding protein, partial [Acidobacteria bacterium]|nr:ATP-binding protein [Acidobacteriota bacterium]
SDNGRGIPEDALPNVFNPFFTANKEGGTGLGLAISHRIVQRHLGLLAIENNRTDGATATVRLPLSQS